MKKHISELALRINQKYKNLYKVLAFISGILLGLTIIGRTIAEDIIHWSLLILILSAFIYLEIKKTKTIVEYRYLKVIKFVIYGYCSTMLILFIFLAILNLF